MKFVFFGTPEFAAIILEKLIQAGFVPFALICNPDKPLGRKKIITPPPTKIIAERHNIQVYQPEKLNFKEFKVSVGELDLAIIAAYGKIIPKSILELPKRGTIGVHPSLLPKYRGPSPIQTAILEGEQQTGVTLFLVDEKVDHGSILAQQTLDESIDAIYYESLLQKLAHLAGEMLMGFLPEFMNGKIISQSQDEPKATFTKKFETKDAFVDLDKDTPESILRKVRALNPEPGVWTYITSNTNFLIRANKKMVEKRMKILEVDLVEKKLVLKKIQFEGKKPQNL